MVRVNTVFKHYGLYIIALPVLLHIRTVANLYRTGVISLRHAQLVHSTKVHRFKEYNSSILVSSGDQFYDTYA
jgi:hypothetical protein